MITLTDEVPALDCENFEYIRIKCLFDCYGSGGDVMFWRQSNGNTLIAMADGNMTVYRNGGSLEELTEFIDVLSPAVLLSDSETLTAVNMPPTETAEVMRLRPQHLTVSDGDRLSSDEIYRIFSKAGLHLPDYPHFAVDLCRRLNRGLATCCGIKEKCAAVAFNTDHCALITGLASLERGYGGKTLRAIIAKNSEKSIVLCCKAELVSFYEKYGFEKTYKIGFVKRNEYK